MPSTKKPEAFTVLTDSTMHDDDDGVKKITAAVPARNEASDAVAPTGPVRKAGSGMGSL